MRIQRPRGTRDFGPEEMAQRRGVEARLRGVAQRFGFREIATPIFEHAELFTAKSGPGIIEEMYAFKDKSGRRLALRPELTAPVMRFYVNDLSKLPKPLKLYYTGPCFRYERPQAGRFREHYQFGAELVGARTPETDAEVIALAVTALREAGLRGLTVRVGHVGILRGLLAAHKLKPAAIGECLHLLDKRETAKLAAFVRSHRLPGALREEIERIVRLRGPPSVLTEAPAGEAVDFLREVFAALGAFGIEGVEADLGVVRGLDYYTGMVFEIDAEGLGAEKQVTGGGSYALSELFGGEPVFSTGFAIGIDRVVLSLAAQGMLPAPEALQAYVIPVSEAQRAEAFRLTSELRAAGISADVDLMRRSLSKALAYAGDSGARFALLLGPTEIAAGAVNVRDLSTGHQELVPRRALAGRLRASGASGGGASG